MEVRPGYKLTEVGLIPGDWRVDYIENLAHITTGGKNTQDRIHDGQHPFFVRSQTVERIDSYSFDGEAVLTAGDGVGTGKVFHYINGKFDAHQRVYRISDFSDRINGYYFFLYFSTHFYNRIIQMTAKSSVDSVRMDMIARMPVPVPPTEAEQRSIAAALSDVDALLGVLERLIDKKRDLKQAAMQQLLTGQTRLPGFRAEWEVSTMGREFEIQLGKMLDSERNVGVPKPFIGNRAVQWGDIEVGELPTVPMSRSDIDRFRLRKGDLLVCEGGEVGRAAIWEAPIEECYYQKALHRLRPIRGFNPRLMAALLRLWSDRGLFSNYVTQTSIAHLPREKFLEMPLSVPSTAEQSAIAAVLSDMDAELSALEARRDKTRALKQGMMQELLTGRTRLV